MKSKLYLLFALLSLTAVFASPALAAPPVPSFDGLNDGDVVRAITPIFITTDGPASKVEVFGNGVKLGEAGQINPDGMHWAYTADFSNEADSASYPIGVAASTVADGAGPQVTVTVVLDKVASPDAPFWMSPSVGGQEFSGDLNLRTGTAAGIDSVDYLVDGEVVDQGVDTSESGTALWDYTLNLELLTLGTHTLTAVAHEGDEFSVASEDMTITVVDGTMPVVEEILPADETVVSGTVQISATITDSRNGVTSAEYSIDGDNWFSLVQSDINETLWEASFDTTELPNGMIGLAVRAHDGNVMDWTGDGFVQLDIQNMVSPEVNLDDVTFWGPLMADGPGIFADGATASGFPEPELIYSWFVCDAGFHHCVNHPGQFYTPTGDEIGYTVRLVVRATSWDGPNGSVEANILVGTVVAAPVWVDPPADPPAGTPVAPPVVVAPPVKSPEVVTAEEKVVEAAKSVEAAKAEVTEEKKDVVKAKAVAKRAKKQIAAAKAEVKEAKADVKDEAKDVAEAKTKLKKAKNAKKNAAKRALAQQAKELAASERQVKAAIKAEVKATANVSAAETKVKTEEKQVAAAEKEVAASETELNNSQKELDKVK